jgi:gluconokinase
VPRVLGLDVGTSAVRARVFDERGAPAGPLGRLMYPGETDPDVLVENVRRAIEEAGGAAGVEAVGVSIFGHSLLPLDDAGRPLTPILGWRDVRSGAQADELARRLDPVTVHARTGCHIHTSYWPAKLLWLAEAEPEIFRDARLFVSFTEYLYARLAGAEPRMSLSTASCTGLLNLFTRVWDEELLDATRLDPARLPSVSDEPAGRWHPALLDGVCSNIGVGATGRSRAALTIGTSGTLRTVFSTREPRPRPGLFLYLIEGERVVEGGALSDGGNLLYWLDRTFLSPDGSLLERGPDEHGLTWLALQGGERSPGWHPHAKGAVSGLTFETTPRDLRQAALEGVGFRFGEVAALMPELVEILATGGVLIRNDEWMQLMADAIGRPLIASSIEESSLRGAAVRVLMRLGERPKPPATARVFHPRSERAEAYRSARERHRRLYEELL